MAQKLYEEQNIKNAVDKIRERSGTTRKYKTSELASGIESVYQKAMQEAGTSVKLQQKSVTPKEQQQIVVPDTNYDGLSKVSVEAIPSQYIVPSGTKQITENGTFDVTSYENAEINVPTTGIDTSDATAIATNIERGKTAYIKGEKVTGELESINSITQYGTVSWEKDALVLTKKREDKAIFNQTEINLKCSGSDLGNATESDVAEGKTFTSTAGLKVVGTRKESVSGRLQKKSGTIVLEVLEGSEQWTDFVIETGLTRVDTVIVRKSLSGTVANTFFWSHDGDANVGGCGYRSQYLTSFSATDRITVDGGSVTCSQQGNDYPILEGNYVWVAYGE